MLAIIIILIIALIIINLEKIWKKEINNVRNAQIINITIKHAGNQDITELNNHKTIKFALSETKKVYDVKKEIEKNIKYVRSDLSIARPEPEYIHLMYSPFGKRLHDDAPLTCMKEYNSEYHPEKELNDITLFVVLENW